MVLLFGNKLIFDCSNFHCRYAMPKEGAKPSKYDDEVIIEELGPNYEQKQWEEDKLGQAKMKFGAKDAKSKNKVTR